MIILCPVVKVLEKEIHFDNYNLVINKIFDLRLFTNSASSFPWGLSASKKKISIIYQFEEVKNWCDWLQENDKWVYVYIYIFKYKIDLGITKLRKELEVKIIRLVWNFSSWRSINLVLNFIIN